MNKWKDFKGWQKGTVIGFSILGITHILFITIDLIFERGSALIHPLGIPIFELPLYILYIFVYSLFKIDIIPEPHSHRIIFWICIYFCGTITWGICGAVLGLFLGFLSDLGRKLGEYR